MDALEEVDAAKLSLPVRAEGVTLPVLIPRPLLLDEALSKPDIVSLPAVDATDGGLETPAVARDSLETLTNTPHIGAQSKYLFPSGVLPSFFPLPANPALSSTPAQIPCFGGISPRYRRIPS